MTTAVAILLTVTACGGSSSSKASATGSSISSAASVAVAAPTATAPTATVRTATAPTSASSAAGVSSSSVSSSSASDGSTSAGPSFVNGGAALADTGNLIYVLEAVNPKIGTNKDDLIAKSKALCTLVNANDSDSALNAAAAKGFTNGSWVPSSAEAEAIVGTVKAYGGC